MTKKIAIHWFRQDLRLSDNPALRQAGKHKRILPIYILEDGDAGKHAMGGASRWWLHHSLNALNKSLNGKLSVYRGNPQRIFDDILARFDVEAVYWNRCYEPWRFNRDKKIKKRLREKEIAVHVSNGSLLWEPWDIETGSGTPYRVFTPFYRKGCLQAESPRVPLSKPRGANYLLDREGTGIDALELLPETGWDSKLEPHWKIGEESARRRLRAFIGKGLSSYKDGRDLPAEPYVSRLSPHLHFGEMSPNQIWHAVRQTGSNKGYVDKFSSEMAWREFSYSLLYYNPELPRKNLQEKFDRFPWQNNRRHLSAWQKGQTGVPVVDAGMRELRQTGYMHNRVRMIVGSFLVKNLLLHWHHGERWFWDNLVDADLANNSANWQWIAGCGADAAASPYFRIFNPVRQGQRFDPEGRYVRKYVPEIAALPDRYLFNPWEAPKSLLEDAGIKLGKTYPKPVVDLKRSREAALKAFRSLKQKKS